MDSYFQSFNSRIRITAVGLALSILLVLLPRSAWSGSAGGEYAPAVELGPILHTGETGTSLTGVTGWMLMLRSEDRKGFFRPFGAFNLEYASGKTSIGAEKVGITLFTGGFQGGFHLFPMSTGRFQPFFGAGAVLSWATLRLGKESATLEPNTQGLAFGWEASAGVDLRLGSSEGNAIRIRSGYYSVSSTLAKTSIALTGFRLSIGIVY